MSDRTLTTVVVSLLLVVSAVGAGATMVGAQSADGETHAGSNVSFATTGSAVVDYAVDGETALESVAVDSTSAVDAGLGVGVGSELSAVTDIAGAALSVDAEADGSATMTTDSGAELRTHDTERGVLTVAAGGESQYVSVGVGADASLESENDGRMVVEQDSGTEGTFLVIGDGEVTANDDGNVTAELEGESQLVFRSYGDERTEDDRRQEELIADGDATAEVAVTGTGAAAADVVRYGENTTVEVTGQAEGSVEMTAERASGEGTVVMTSVSEAVVGSAEDLEVTVDGEAAAEASSYSELRTASQGGETSRYMVTQDASAEASAEVLVAVNHFSEREIAIQAASDADGDGSDTGDGSDDGDGSDGSDGEDGTDGDGDDETSDDSVPGFGLLVAIGALVASLLATARLRG